MRRIILLTTVVAALTVMLLISAHSQTPRTTTQRPQVTARTSDERQAAVRRTITTQQRLNRYFHDNVIPKLRNCWSRIQGRGMVEINQTYIRDAGGKWVADKMSVGTSTLPRGQEAVALQCMQDSVRATSFAAEGGDGDGRQYVVRWTWPVPLPVDAAEQTRKMFLATGTGPGTGCDGQGTPEKCVNCPHDSTGRPSACIKVCVGAQECETFYSPELKGLNCRLRNTCVSGGPFGVAGGGVVIY